MNPPDELRDGSRAAGWLNKLLAFVKMTRLVEGVGYRLIQTTRGTALEIQPGKGGATGVPSWRGEWQYWETELSDGEEPRPRKYEEGDMVIRGGETVLSDDNATLISAGDVAGTWIASRALALGEAPGEPSAEETASGSLSWTLVARFSAPVFTAKRGQMRAGIGANINDATVSVSGGSSGGSVSISVLAAKGKQISLRELSVCQNGVMRKMIVLASGVYD